MLDSVILLHYAASMAQKPTPKPRQVRISVMLTRAQHDRLKELAKLNNRSATKQASTLLAPHLV
jgi:hypothetical protein